MCCNRLAKKRDSRSLDYRSKRTTVCVGCWFGHWIHAFSSIRTSAIFSLWLGVMSGGTAINSMQFRDSFGV